MTAHSWVNLCFEDVTLFHSGPVFSFFLLLSFWVGYGSLYVSDAWCHGYDDFVIVLPWGIFFLFKVTAIFLLNNNNSWWYDECAWESQIW